MQPIRIACLFDGSIGRPTACAYIRLLLPLTSPADRRYYRVDFLGLNDIKNRFYDIVVTQRIAFGDQSGLDQLLKLQRLGTRIVYDLDDDLISIDHTHPEVEHYTHLAPTILEAISASDEVWFSTVELAHRYGHNAKSYAVHHNRLDHRLWRPRDLNRPRPNRPFSVLFMGSNTHEPDIMNLLSPALARINKDFGDRFKFFSIGVKKSAFGDVPVSSIDVPGAIAGSYPAFANWLQRLPQFDLGVAPLLPSPINKSKSHIKWLEYAGMGLPTIASKVGEYADSVGYSGPGVLAADWSEFYAGIAEHGSNPDLHSSLCREVSDFVKTHLASSVAETERFNRLNLLAARAA